MPLFHPCRCAGSIRHIHKECLVRWISIKSSANKSRDDGATHSDDRLLCEICGFEVQFRPVLSSEYKGDSLRTTCLIFLEIITGLFKTAWLNARPIVGLCSFGLFVPFLVGLVITASTSLFASGQYWDMVSTVPNIVENATTICVIGYIGTVLLVPHCTWLGVRLALALAPLTGFVSWTATVLVGGLITSSSVFSDVSADIVNCLRGTGVLGSIAAIIWGISHRSSATREISYYAKLAYHGICLVIVPLTVGVMATYGSPIDRYIVPDDEDLTSLSEFMPYLSVFVFYFILGAMLMVGIHAYHEHFWRYVVTRDIRRRLKLNRSVVASMLGRNKIRAQSESFGTMIELVGLGLFGIFFGISPVVRILQKLDLCPVWGLTIPDHESSSLNIIPIEIFYMHLLIPMVLAAPPVPSIVQRVCSRFKSSFHKSLSQSASDKSMIVRIFVVRQLLFNVGFGMSLGVPTLMGRVILGPNDSLSFTIGSVGSLAILHAVFRSVYAVETYMRNGIMKGWFRRVFSTVIVGIVVFAVIPILAGFSFHLAFLIPLQELHKTTGRIAIIVSDSLDSRLAQVIPVWIIGLMMLKVAIALSSLRRHQHPLMRVYFLNGVFDPGFQRGVLGLSGKIVFALSVHALAPAGVGISLQHYGLISEFTRKHVLAAYIAALAIVRVVVPRTYSWWRIQRAAAFQKKFVVKRQLQNADWGDRDDSVINT
jgi:hypothetical protein